MNDYQFVMLSALLGGIFAALIHVGIQLTRIANVLAAAGAQ